LFGTLSLTISDAHTLTFNTAGTYQIMFTGTAEIVAAPTVTTNACSIYFQLDVRAPGTTQNGLSSINTLLLASLSTGTDQTIDITLATETVLTLTVGQTLSLRYNLSTTNATLNA